MLGNWNRLASLSGVVFGGSVIAAIFVGGNTPSSDWSAERVVSWYTTHHGSQTASVYILGYGAVFALFFAAALRAYMRSRAGSDGLIALGFAGGVVFALAMTLGAGLTAAAIDVPGKISPAAEQALSVVNEDLSYIALLVGMVAFGLGNGIAILASGALPKWLGWLAIALGVVAAIPPIGWFSLFAVAIWAVIVSIVMFMRQTQVSAPAAT